MTNSFFANFSKRFARSLTMLLAASSIALAANVPVAPFSFGGTTATDSVKWDQLMKYKLWALGSDANSAAIFLYGKVYITDTVGYVGSPKGGLEFTNQFHELGGPILFAGGFKNSDGYDSFLNGPNRFKQQFEVGGNGKGKNHFNGYYCFEKGITNYDAADFNNAMSDCSKVPPVDENLSMPSVKSGYTYSATINSITRDGSHYFIDVPPGTDVYDIQVGTISMQNNGNIYVRMPPEGRPTRIFVTGNVNFTNSTSVKVIYAKDENQWNKTAKTWSMTENDAAPDSLYNGDLLLYFAQSLSFPAGSNNRSMQGTIISPYEVNIKQHMSFAGQIIAKKITIDADFKADQFRYVPFNPPEIDSKALASGAIHEGLEDEVIAARLNKKPSVPVTIKYCFAFESGANANQKKTGKTDTTAAVQGDLETSGIPLCSNNASASVKFTEDGSALETPIKLTAVDDALAENTEFFYLRVLDITGGVLDNGKRTGDFKLYIVDNDDEPSGRDTTITAIVAASGDSIGYEDVPFKIESFPAYLSVSQNGVVSQSPMSSYKVKIVSAPVKGSLKNGSTVIKAGSVISSADITSGKLTFASAANDFGDSTNSFEYTKFTFKIVDAFDDESKDTYKMIIQVLPVNDKPLFDKSKVQNGKLTVSIAENSPVKTVLTTVTAQDDVDSTRDAWDTLTYKLVNVSGTPSNVFQVNSKTGAITVKADSLNYEKRPSYEMKIVVTDRGVPKNRTNKLTDTILVHVDVTDVNEPPVFDTTDYAFNVNENSPVNKVVGTFTVTDEDTKDDLTVSLIGSNLPFSVKKVDSRTFNLIVSSATLNFEKTPSYSFKASVTDGQITNTANVVVKINDVNEKPLIADATLSVDENSPKGKKVGTVKVTDEDTWTVMSYALKDSTKDVSKVFEIKPASSCQSGYFCGDIFLKDSVLDFEKTAVYYMYVIVTDNGQSKGFPPNLSDTAVVTIKINDKDEPPVLTPTATDVNVKEHGSSSAFVAGYKVTDPDKNHTLEFTMKATDGHSSLPFALVPVSDKDSAYVKTNKSLDYETMDTLYKVRVIVTDNSGLRDSADLTIRVKDINEAPAFDKTSYTARINEKYSKDDSVWVFTAKDKDTKVTPATKLTYSMGDVYDVTDTSNKVKVTGLFGISSIANKGVVLVTKDGMLGQSYAGHTFEVVVTVKDNGSSQNFFDNKKDLSATTTLTIVVTNENDPPYLENRPFNFNIDENTSSGVLVGTIRAEDEDLKDKLTFDIVVPSGASFPFEVQKVSDREIKLVVAQNAKLDYEKDSVYKFKVTVTDGIAADTADGTIKINDVNEEPKIMTADLYIDENSAVGDSVGDVLVTDQDLWTKMNYKLLDSTAGATDIFKIASNSKCTSGYFCGLITVKKAALNFEKDSVYYLYVVATDNGAAAGFAPDLADTALLKIHINDKNDPPKFDSSKVTVGVDENSPVGTSVGNVAIYASDEDNKYKVKDNLTYSLIAVSKNSATFFTIDASTGEITVAMDSLDYETVAVYQVDVRVTDNRGAESADTLHVTIKVNDVNEKPTIAQQKFDVDELEPVGTVLNGSPVKDGDLDTASAFKVHKYFAVDGDTALFAIDSLTAELTTKVKLVYSDTAKDFSLTVRVVDYSVPGNPLDSEGVMLITLNDVNNAPVIAPDSFQVKENSPESTFVGQIVATDDEDPASALKFSLVGTSKDFDVSESGVITVKKGANIDYERIKSYTLQVEVSDLKGLTSVGKIKINVVNVPEAPVIEADTFHVAETAVAKTLVGKAIAMDQEDPDSLLTYALIGTSDEFEVSTSGRITVKKSGVLDYESTTSYVLEIYVTDTDSMSDTARFLIIVDDVNEAPEIQPAEFHVAENSPANTKVGTLVAHDAEDPDSVLVFALAEKSNEFEVSTSGRITVKKGANLDYETKNRYELKVSVTDTKNASSTATVKILIDDIREIPTIDDTTIVIREDAKPDTTFAKLVIDNPEGDKVKVTLITKTNVFKVSEDGKITLVDTLDYESKKKYELVVKVEGEDGSIDTAHVTIKVQNVVEVPEVTITRANDEDSVWLEPDTIYTHTREINLEWTVDKKLQPDTLVKLPKDSTYVVRLCYDDPTKDKPGCDTVVIVVDNSIPKVTISKTAEDTAAISNVTIVEQVAENDTNFYVNHELNEVRIHIKDKATKTDSTFKTNLRLDSLLNIKNSLSDIKKVSKKNSITMDDAESADVTKKTLINDKTYAVSFETEVDGKKVTVSYNTDKKGNKIKNDDGDVVMTVEYKTVVGGKDVTVSYKVNGSTGELIKNDNGGSYEYAYEFDDEFGGHVGVRYSVDDKGEIVKNEEGNYGYQVSYTYKNKFGNVATKNIFIVVDKVVPVVKIVTPENKAIVRTRGVAVEWTVDGVVQDTLGIQGLKKGLNPIVRTYRDKAGNEASDTVFVVMKDPKDVKVHVVKPVTIINADSVEKYYGDNPPKEGQSFAVSLYNPYEDKEAKTVVGGSFGKKDADGEEPYAGLNGGHLGPTLAFDFVTPRCGENPASGLCTLDDLLERDGLIALDAGGGWDREKVTVDEYVNNYCSKEFRKEFKGDLKTANLYKITLHVSVWIYTNLGGFLNEYHFTQEMNDPQYVDEVGQSKMFFELTPDLAGDVRTADGRLLGTGAYLFKTSIKSVAELRCKLPDEEVGHKRYATDELLKSFGYKRPKQK